MKKIFALSLLSVLFISSEALALNAASRAVDEFYDGTDRDCTDGFGVDCHNGGGGGGGGGTTSKPNTGYQHFCFANNATVGSDACSSSNQPSPSMISSNGCKSVACDTCWYCKSCLPGYHLNNGACVKDSGGTTTPITSCTIANCLTCSTNNLTCVSCEAGYYPSSSKTSCLSCSTTYTGCNTCNANGCKSCKDGYTASSNGNGYVTCSRTLQPVLCEIANCKTCNRLGTQCTVCETGYYLNNGACTKCPNHAKSCDGDGKVTECEAGYSLAVNGMCVIPACSTCNNGMGISDNVQQICKTCESAYGAGCSTCSCSGCSTCSRGYYLNGSSHKCVRCPDHAVSCDGNGRSTGCENGYSLALDGRCVVPACSSCNDGMGISDNIQQICKTCASAYGAGCSLCNCSGCTTCESGYSLNALTKKCVKCPDHATACDGNGRATSCEMGYLLNNSTGKCEARGCTTCSGTSPDIGVSVYENGLGMCKMCSVYFSDSDCDKCDCTGCKICKSGKGLNSLGKCYACGSNEMAMTVNGKSKCCSTKAPTGYGTTYVCDKSKDVQWTGFEMGTPGWNAYVNCISGSLSNYIDDDPTGACHKVCEAGKYWNGSNCVSCSAGAATCDDEGNDVTCKLGYTKNLMGQCVISQCRTCNGQPTDIGISDNVSMTCKTCATVYGAHCSTCDCTSCKTCDSPLYMVSGGRCMTKPLELEAVSCEAPYVKCEGEMCCELKE
ncbi:MAG: hypothetical protein MJ247_05320 [Alphaproteobacteria bacterium]|nr:hypothetical protein [Alphaproteobacteria bacterium]